MDDISPDHSRPSRAGTTAVLAEQGLSRSLLWATATMTICHFSFLWGSARAHSLLPRAKKEAALEAMRPILGRYLLAVQESEA